MRLVVLLLAATLATPGLAFVLFEGEPRWEESTAGFYINIPGTSPMGGTWRAALIRAMDAWSVATGFQFVAVDGYIDPCGNNAEDESTNSVDFGNTVCGEAFGRNVAGIALFTVSRGFIIEADIIFNSNTNFDIYNGPVGATVDFERVALHEFGHTIGLRHEPTLPAIMQARTSNLDTLQQDDINGANFLYGPPPPTVDICDRTPQVEAAIVAAITPTPACESVVEADLAAITTLDLSDGGITSLASGDFTGMPALATLLLDDNALTTLPAGVFDNLAALATLDLSTNVLTTLPAGIFDGLAALATLDLRDNDFITLPVDVFDDVLDTLGRIDVAFRVDDTVRDAHFVCSRVDADAIVADTAGADDCLRITTAQIDAAILLDLNQDQTVSAQDAQILYYLSLTPRPDNLLSTLLGNAENIAALETGAAALTNADLDSLDEVDGLDQNDWRLLYYVLRFGDELSASPALRRALGVTEATLEVFTE